MRLMTKDKNFDSIEQLVNYVNLEIKKCMIIDVANEIKEIGQENVQTNVLDVYEPKFYERRSDDNKDDSLKYSWDVLIEESMGDLILEVGSSAKPVDRKFGDLGDNIEEGYGGKDKPWTQPRPFIEPLQEQIDMAKTTENVLKNKLDFFE